MTVCTLTVDSPVGALRLTAKDGSITRLDWAGDAKPDDGPAVGTDAALLDRAARHLAEYFDHARHEFDLPLDPQGTPHEGAVWREMLSIGYGATRSYGEIATAIGSSPRAVGTACGRNPIPVIIPCHRALAAHGGIGGYSGAGGIDTKRRLLALEGAMLAV
ncbi:MAG: methylated-DNA--[protein]-cysteine S-methyltransferase [Alphaproteobacteria bacterium]|jgi:methylated-DNA-[protein]-cysteine S-methyltransferase